MMRDYFHFYNVRTVYFVPKKDFEGVLGFRKKAFEEAQSKASQQYFLNGSVDENIVQTTWRHATRFKFGPYSAPDTFDLNIEQISVEYDSDAGQTSITFGDQTYEATLSLDTTNHEEIKKLAELLLNIVEAEKKQFRHVVDEIHIASDVQSLQRALGNPKEPYFFSQKT